MRKKFPYKKGYRKKCIEKETVYKGDGKIVAVFERYLDSKKARGMK